MKEYFDASNRLTFDLSGQGRNFKSFSDQMIFLYGPPVQKLNGLDQYYWDFDVNGVIVVLHWDSMAGMSIHVEDGMDDELLRTIVAQLEE